MIRSVSQRSLSQRGGRFGLAVLGAVSALILAGCATAGEPAATGTADNTGIPSYYPVGYQSVIDASKAEGGDLVIYSNTDQENWAPVFRDFQKKYPWVTNISANNLESDAVFQRQLSEMATGSAPADILVSNAVQAWATYVSQPNTVLKYTSPELKKLPAYAQLSPNVYAMSLDPIGLVYNTALMSKVPKSIAGLASIIAADPAKYKGKITARDVKGAFGFTVSHAFTEGNSTAWSSLEGILPSARPETSSGTQLEKILSGEYLAGFYISSAPAYPAEQKSGGLIKFVYPTDGTVVIGRGLGITPKAPHAATAKLFLDFVLSAEGQNAVAEGGLTSYRDGVASGEGRHTYQEIEKVTGAKAIIRVPYTVVSDADVQTFVTRWNGLLG